MTKLEVSSIGFEGIGTGAKLALFVGAGVRWACRAFTDVLHSPTKDAVVHQLTWRSPSQTRSLRVSSSACWSRCTSSATATGRILILYGLSLFWDREIDRVVGCSSEGRICSCRLDSVPAFVLDLRIGLTAVYLFAIIRFLKQHFVWHFELLRRWWVAVVLAAGFLGIL